ncbi:MAG: SRPBCC family protein [Bacteroidetes bacterium]|nr:SRPBCC family protein [Bacteroidota bacterium]
MKILKKIGIALLAIIAIALITAAFTRKDYAVEREIVINKPNAEVFNYVKNLKNQNYFSKWNMTDPNAKMDYKGTDGTVGFIASWDSQNDQVGTGEQEIMSIVEGSRMDVELRFTKPFVATDKGYFITQAEGDNQTKVKWGFKGKMDYPMNLMLLLMNMEEMIGNDMATSLGNLKVLLEKQ